MSRRTLSCADSSISAPPLVLNRRLPFATTAPRRPCRPPRRGDGAPNSPPRSRGAPNLAGSGACATQEPQEAPSSLPQRRALQARSLPFSFALVVVFVFSPNAGIAANFGADWAEDVCSLERVGILPSLGLGALSHEFLLFAEYCQFALALVEILVTGVRARKERQVVSKAEAGGAEPDKMLKQRRKLALVRLELVKYVSDVGKALYDCELPFAHEGVFIGCALFSGVLSTHKNIVKVYK